MKKQAGGFGFYFVILILMAFIWYFISTLGMNNADYNYHDFEADLEANNIKKVVIVPSQYVPTGTLELTFNDKKTTIELYVTDTEEAKADMDAVQFYNYSVGEVEGDSIFLTTILPLGISIVAVIFMLFSSQSSAGGSKMANFGKSRAKMMTESAKKVTFAEVAGLAEEKEELEEIVDFLKSPKKYIEVGARIPKGVILVGPPGTGKTLLAKAVAGEAGVPFFSISGSDFVEMFVGVGASRVRDLFEEAKKNAPCIVFIDKLYL